MATIISGKELAKKIRDQVQKDVQLLKETSGVKPGLAIVQVGNREDSNVYVKSKVKQAHELGMSAKHVKLPTTVSQAEVIDRIQELNEDPDYHGIIVQLPLDCEQDIDSALCTNMVIPEKDVDGINDINAGRLSRGQLHNCFTPCTPKGCLELIKESGMKIQGADAVVLGRSKIVGSPMANLLTWNNATVTICHSRTKNLRDVVRSGDIVVAAVGVTEMVKGDWIKPGAVVIDCGITAVPDASKKSGQRLVGDVNYQECKKVAGYITPVPGGVGPMTVAMLLANTVESGKRYAAQMATQKAGLGIGVEALKLIRKFARVRF
eukprot:Seg2476.2 transcript_id=Seg2476.2/GoldUCD/mRNA.D3Y31 product="C-1-tetrahydrofolate synthase cytoplasmic" protein_id=Seg2476.2/GoldUCD/D3Y31